MVISHTPLFYDAGKEVDEIPVHISYEIIHLFSEGLYKSPHKAIEELVTNSYDANAKRVNVLLPESDDEASSSSSLWVIDDGLGMDEEGFHRLWWIAKSDKTGMVEHLGRPIIGQFGIGKLASYVLAWNLAHISHVDGRYLLTSMNFRDVTGIQLSEHNPVKISLREVDEQTARSHLIEIESRDPTAWEYMFGDVNRSSSWTAAALSDFKDLFGRLRAGTLKWVLSAGLPLHSDFQIRLNGAKIRSSKEKFEPLKRFTVEETLNGIGQIRGQASIYERRLTEGKSDQIGRSNGFFVRVRNRVINLEDELFGLEAQNHGAWSRFEMEVDADGLRPYLLSSREGVRECEETREFRAVLRKAFNLCRSVYDAKESQSELDLLQLLDDTPSIYVREPLFNIVRRTAEAGTESFYIGVPSNVGDEGMSVWLEEFEEQIGERPVNLIQFKASGQNAPALQYNPNNRNLLVNREHPFIDKLRSSRTPRKVIAELFASSEALLEGQLEEHGVSRQIIASLLDDRDRVLRLVAGYATPSIQEVTRRLEVATTNDVALERATGSVFALLGFKYEVKGGNNPGPDGVLYARLGRHTSGLADYKVVYDAKQTNSPAVPADKVDFSSLEDFRDTYDADFGFFIAEKYQGERDKNAKLNREIRGSSGAYGRLVLLKVEHLKELVRLHNIYGLTLTVVRSLFEHNQTVADVDNWLQGQESTLIEEGEIPLQVLLEGLEATKDDQLAKPNIAVVRNNIPDLKTFAPERLRARLRAVESIIGSGWIEIDNDSFEVIMHQTSREIVKELERQVYFLDDESSDE